MNIDQNGAMHTHIKEAFRNVTKQGGGSVAGPCHQKNHRDRGFDLDFDQCLTIKQNYLLVLTNDKRLF